MLDDKFLLEKYKAVLNRKLSEGYSLDYAEVYAHYFVEGYIEGYAEGERVKQIELARNLKRLGLGKSDISKSTGLSDKDIEDL